MKLSTPRILSNRPLCSDFYEMAFSWEPSLAAPLPGQFFTLRISEDSVPLLRRPFAFSAFDAAAGSASMIYQNRGRGTELLTGKRAHDTLNLLGPLGKGFPLPGSDRHPLLVAGGIGLGPVLFLASAIRRQGRNPGLVFGCRSAALIPALPSLSDLSPVICTDDGSAGFKGTAGDYLSSIEPSVVPKTVLYACGPMPMLKACRDLALRKGCDCFVSVEQVMACGVGACMGCAIKMAAGGYKRACIEGPVFHSKEIAW
jgi:dihydroorotate dehydrogenase electron transfer subunit